MRRDCHYRSSCYASGPPRFEPLEARQLFAVDLGGSLIAHWTFDDVDPTPATFADTSPDGSNHPATRQGDAAAVPQNTTNNVLQLDGASDYLRVTNAADINLGIHPNRSVAFWFRADDVSLTSRKQVIYEEGGTTRGLIIYVYDNRLYVGGWNNASSESAWAGTWLNTTGIESGRWHHVALTLDGRGTTTSNALSGYLDGQRFARGEGSQLWTRTGSITIGNHSDGTRFHDGNVGTLTAGFAGQLDDGRLYNRTLQSADVRQLARGPAEAVARVGAKASRLEVHEMQYALLPETALEVTEVSSPRRVNAEQSADFPALASGDGATVLPNDESHASPIEVSQSPRTGWQPNALHLWPELTAWLIEQENEEPATSEITEVDPQASPLR